MPLLHSLRGGGLANEAFPWAKAFIGAQELGLRCLHPAWGLNPRNYSADFGTTRLDAVAHWALRRGLRTVRITPALVEQTGEADYGLAVRALAPELGLEGPRPVVVTHESMHGGWTAIERARSFLRRELLRPPHVVRDLYAVEGALDPEKLTIGVHLRYGDFARSDSGPRPGEYNTALPDTWYASVVEGLLNAFTGQAQALLVTDDPSAAVVHRLLAREGVLVPPPRPRPALSDLLALAAADVLVCSVSAYSMLAAFLSESPYVWFEPHLNDHGGWQSIWGHEEVDDPQGPTMRNLAVAGISPDPVFGRGFAANGDGRIPDALRDVLERRLWLKKRSRDLIFRGVARR